MIADILEACQKLITKPHDVEIALDSEAKLLLQVEETINVITQSPLTNEKKYFNRRR